ncbi:hypothetical protein D3C77_662260 [compost metagenome]
MTSSNESRKSWWETLPAILTGLATLIGALAGLYTVLHNQDGTDSPPATEARVAQPQGSPSPDTVQPPCGVPFAERPISCLGDEANE